MQDQSTKNSGGNISVSLPQQEWQTVNKVLQQSSTSGQFTGQDKQNLDNARQQIQQQTERYGSSHS